MIPKYEFIEHTCGITNLFYRLNQDSKVVICYETLLDSILTIANNVAY